jgi:hypothetical protein
MARSAGAAQTVLTSLRMMYDSGGDQEFRAAELVRVFDALGVRGFTDAQGTYFLMLGTVLRLLLRHAETDVDEMFAKARVDIEALGRDIDDQKFEEITKDLEGGDADG